MDRLACDRMLVAVVDAGSFAAGAARLGTSAGQASKMVARLEADLGIRLLNRTTRALSPTELGRAYVERMRSLLEEIDSLDQSLRDTSGAPQGVVRITAPLTFGTLQLVPALTAFGAAYPLIRLDVSFSDRVVSLVDEGFDLAVRIGNPSDTSLMARKLCETSVMVVASAAYLDRHPLPHTPADLLGHDCLIDTNFRDAHVWRFQDPAGGPEQAVTLPGRMIFSNAEACLRAAELGAGIARVPDFVAGPSVAAGRVRAVLAAYAQGRYGVFAMYPAGRHLPTKVRVLLDFLAKRFYGVGDWAALGH